MPDATGVERHDGAIATAAARRGRCAPRPSHYIIYHALMLADRRLLLTLNRAVTHQVMRFDATSVASRLLALSISAFPHFTTAPRVRARHHLLATANSRYCRAAQDCQYTPKKCATAMPELAT